MKKLNFFFLFVFVFVSLVSCGGDNGFDWQPDAPGTENGNGNENGNENENQEQTAAYNEQYRPQMHYTPAKNWINDPNGMVYIDGTWHLFYQYNPYGNDWGNMSWGHATSSDMIHWTEQKVALVKDNLGDIFSGSAVYDKDNTAGFGNGAMVCLYTSSGQRQQQSMAYSTDGGKTFTTYTGNPIIGNTDKDDFRDPKVFWHEPSGKWVMALARGWSYLIDFYSSKDLRSWEYLSTFSTPDIARCNQGQWECPDLININGKYVLIVSVNPGGPAGGSGTMYFPGEFDGTTFTADNGDYPLWLDYGSDNYAGVTWSNAPDGRVIYLGWMNNWQYTGNVPCSPWRSAMTLPRELSITEVDGRTFVAQHVVKELDALGTTWTDLTAAQFPEGDAYHLQVTIDMKSNHVISLFNAADEHYDIEVKPSAGMMTAQRNKNSGKVDFHGLFSKPVKAELNNDKAATSLTLDIYIDRSSVEVITSNGATAITNLVYPSSIYNSITVDGHQATGKVRALKRIW